MRANLKSLVVGLVVLSSCGVKDEIPPVDYATMAAIQAEMLMADIYAPIAITHGNNAQIAYPEQKRDSLAIYYSSIFKHHQLSASKYFDAIDWYVAHPHHYDSVLKRCNNIISELEQETLIKHKDNPKIVPPLHPDSIVDNPKQ